MRINWDECDIEGAYSCLFLQQSKKTRKIATLPDNATLPEIRIHKRIGLSIVVLCSTKDIRIRNFSVELWMHNLGHSMSYKIGLGAIFPYLQQPNIYTPIIKLM